MSLISVASHAGITSKALEALLRGEATVAVAGKLGCTTNALQNFINGTGGPGISSALNIGLSTDATYLAQVHGPKGAIGIVLGVLLSQGQK